MSDDCEHYEGFGDMILELPGGSCKKYQIREGNDITLF
jgi:uncharacterized membrane protein (UPF0127 family)